MARTASDKRGQRKADDATKSDELPSALNKHDEDDCWDGAEEQVAEATTGAELVAYPSHGETEQDGAGDGGGAGITPLSRGELEIGLDVRVERRRREGGVERREEAEPRGVEGGHMRLRTCAHRFAEGRGSVVR